MPDQLTSERYTEEKSALVADFFFGNEEYETEIETWIKGEEVRDALERQAHVLLYRVDGELAGYGCVGEMRRSWPPQDRRADKIDVSVIPALGVLPAFQGKPLGVDYTERYSYQIIQDLIAIAAEYGHKILVLYVHPENAKAIAFYERLGFVDEGPKKDKYRIMSMTFPDEVLGPPAPTS